MAQAKMARAGQFISWLDCTDTNAHGGEMGPTSVVLKQWNEVSPIPCLISGRLTARKADEEAGT